jgi:hypothetical protein
MKTMLNELPKPKAASRLAAIAGSEIAHADATAVFLHMLIALGLTLIVIMAHVNAMVTLILLTALILVLTAVVGYVRWKRINRRESRSQRGTASIDEAEMLWNSHYLRNRKSDKEHGRIAS